MVRVSRAQSGVNEGIYPTPASIDLPKFPRLQLQPVPGYGPAPLTVGFLISGIDTDTAIRSFHWNFGDGQVSTLPPTALFHTYTQPGSYVVTMVATTAGGRTVSAFGGVIVTAPTR